MLWVASHISLSVWWYFHGCGAAIIITHRVTNDRKASSVRLSEAIMNCHEFIVVCRESREFCIEEITNITCGSLNVVYIIWVFACEAAARGNISVWQWCHLYWMLLSKAFEITDRSKIESNKEPKRTKRLLICGSLDSLLPASLQQEGKESPQMSMVLLKVSSS